MLGVGVTRHVHPPTMTEGYGRAFRGQAGIFAFGPVTVPWVST